MVYLNNDNNKQDVYIPRNDGQGSYTSRYDEGYQAGYNNGFYEGCEECSHDCDLERKSVVVTADTMTVTPSSGYEGFSAVDIDATEWGQSKYNEGEDDQKARLSSATFVENGEYTLADGWSAVTVQVGDAPCPPCPEPNLENKTVELESGTTLPTTITPSSGYDGFGEVTIEDNGYGQEKYDEGFGDGEDYIRSGMTATAFTQNNTYTNVSGWSAVTVNVPTSGGSNLQNKSVVLTAETQTVLPDTGFDGMTEVDIDATDLCEDHYSSGYTSGYTDGQADCPSCDTVSDFKTIVTGTDETVCVGFSRPSAPSGETVYGGSYAELKSLIDTYRIIDIMSWLDQAHTDWIQEGYFTYSNDQYIYYNHQGDITFPLDEIGPSWTNTENNDNIFLWGDGMNIFFYTKYPYGWATRIPNLTPNDLILELAEGDAAECIHIDSSEVYESGRQAGYDDGYADGQSNCPAPNLESVTVQLNSGWTGFTQVYPSSGYDGISDVIIADVGFGETKYKSGYTAGQTDLSLLLYVTSDAATADTGTVSATTFEDLGGSFGVLREPISITENENMYMYKEPQHHTPENYEYGCIKFDKPLGRIQYFNFASADKGRVTEILLPDTMMVFLGPWETGYFRGLYDVFGDMPQLQKVRFPSLLKNICGFNTCPMLESVVIPRTCSVVHAAFGQTGIKEIEFPPCTTYWENNTLRCSAVEKLIIRGDGYIGKGFCSGRSYSGFTGTDFTPALSEIYCYSTNPPVFNENNTPISPSDTDAPFADQKQNGTLYVPTGYANAYADWLNFLPSGWTISATL